MITKVTFVGDNFTRKAPKYERFIRPTGLRFKKAHVTHPELQATFYLDILGVKKNPQGTSINQVPFTNTHINSPVVGLLSSHTKTNLQ